MEKTRLKLSSAERVVVEKEALAKKLEESCRQDTSKDTSKDASKELLRDTSANSPDESAKQDTFDSLRNRLKTLEAENALLKVYSTMFSLDTGHVYTSYITKT